LINNDPSSTSTCKDQGNIAFLTEELGKLT
jgi:hypothetical protein